MGPPTGLILALQERMGLGDFVETGTFRGDTAAWAAGHFSRVATIELSPVYHAAALVRFQSQPNVRALQGNSGAMLRQVVGDLTAPALFWLDAHWSGLDTAGREAECPLLDEVSVVNSSTATHAILVDDARLFCAPPPRPHRAEQWPGLAATVSALSDGGRRQVVLLDDVFVAVPADFREFLGCWLQDQATATRTEGRLARWWKKVRG